MDVPSGIFVALKRQDLRDRLAAVVAAHPELALLGTSCDGAACHRRIAYLRPDVIVLGPDDLRPGGFGRGSSGDLGAAALMVLSDQPSLSELDRAEAAGAVAYASADSELRTLAVALRAACAPGPLVVWAEARGCRPLPGAVEPLPLTVEQARLMEAIAEGAGAERAIATARLEPAAARVAITDLYERLGASPPAG